MHTIKMKHIPLFMIITLFIIALVVFVLSGNIRAQKNYTPMVTNIGRQPDPIVPAGADTIQINHRGERYGSAKYIDIGMLDLVLAQGTNGEVGYVRASDLDEPAPKSPEEAASLITYSRTINLYAEDGTTIIGVFNIG
ncbi:MAG: hypothetical protein SCM11_00985 [Bacillota bacterium]|nr:hypothetical protein [Bacillota bacterium]